ncbi:fumarylacetoacetate hydrolase family protein [Skermania sp. ID1734]|uniref:fumarylacetoacetate hydrolase family protein n=1 Tax=Skermania sp. ID1734 TaxID=2597516 RepID=UPI00117D0880|nr:fumarylacetoacetate hydrolase family protein [Skermania sp. ID1734]TSE00688.1 fumarylacetoacetate hydrolase family protein [Skermania sp. ID1734]
MRIGVLNGRTVIVDGQRAVDVADASNGRFGPAPAAVYDAWTEFSEWAATAPTPNGTPYDSSALENPVPEPRQIFAIGLNYAEHAAESHYAVPEFPPVFTKYRSSLAGPRGEVELAGPKVDWEVELVAVIGRPAHRVPESEGWNYVAGLTVGQDISERETQFAATPPQFSLGKSFPGFSPVGPVLVTVDELADPDDLELGCDINGEQVQKGRTSEMIFSVPQLVSRLSHITPLLAGDLIFTGTPAGVGLGRTPQRFLAAGDVLRSYIAGIGEIEQTFVQGQ